MADFPGPSPICGRAGIHPATDIAAEETQARTWGHTGTRFPTLQLRREFGGKTVATVEPYQAAKKFW